VVIRPFDGETFGASREIALSSSPSPDDIRGWEWDGRTASYVLGRGRRSALVIRPFDGQTFGPFREIALSSAGSPDDVRGWSWVP
jgi:hypothetical protein